MTSPGPPADGARAGQALFGFVRHWSRRWIGPTDTEQAERGRDVLTAEAVHALSGHDQVTVNDVAAELALDQSGASRMITQATGRGYLAVTPSPTDGRRRTVALTVAGLELLHAAHEWQDAVFAALTDDWTPTERAEFHRAMTRLLARSAELSDSARQKR